MAGSTTVRGLDRQAEIEPAEQHYFPLWHLQVADGNTDQVLVEPAAASTLAALSSLQIPSGALRFVDPDTLEGVVQPTIPLETVVSRLHGRRDAQHLPSPLTPYEASLIHVPLYLFRYRYGPRSYSAVVEGSSGQVLSDFYPARWELPFRAMGALAFVVLLLAALSGYLLLPMLGHRLPSAFVLRTSLQATAGALLCLLALLVARKA
jgi:hypothetical protein